MIKEAGADKSVLALKSYEALANVANGQATKIILPADLQGVASIGTLINEMIEKK